MNRAQQIILSLGLLIVIGFCLRPPYQWEYATYRANRESGAVHKAETGVAYLGHCWVWRPPQNWTSGYIVEMSRPRGQETRYTATIDWPRLGVYVGLTAMVSLFLALVVFRQPEKVYSGIWKGREP